MDNDKQKQYLTELYVRRSKGRNPPTVTQRIFAYMYIRFSFKDQELFTAKELADTVDVDVGLIHKLMTEAQKFNRIQKIKRNPDSKGLIKPLLYKLSPWGIAYGKHIYDRPGKYKLDMSEWLIDVL